MEAAKTSCKIHSAFISSIFPLFEAILQHTSLEAPHYQEIAAIDDHSQAYKIDQSAFAVL